MFLTDATNCPMSEYDSPPWAGGGACKGRQETVAEARRGREKHSNVLREIFVPRIRSAPLSTEGTGEVKLLCSLSSFAIVPFVQAGDEEDRRIDGSQL